MSDTLHDKLIERIDLATDESDGILCMRDALYAVIDLHKPDDYNDCVECGVDFDENSIPYPCNTVKAVSAALGVASGPDGGSDA